MKNKERKERKVIKERVARKQKKGREGKGRVGTTKEKDKQRDCAKEMSKGQRKEGTWIEGEGWKEMKQSKGKEKKGKERQGN